MRARILVSPKPGILDPQGEAVKASLRALGFAVEGVRVGRLVDIDLGESAGNQAAARDQVEQMCERLLANPLIESYEVELEGNTA